MSEAKKQTEAKKSSQKSPSEAQKKLDEKRANAGGNVTDEGNAQVQKDAEEAQQKAAEGKLSKVKKSELKTNDDGEVLGGQAQYELPDGYDPYTDPVVPSSAVADNVATELKALGESPTLQALRDGAEKSSKK